MRINPFMAPGSGSKHAAEDTGHLLDHKRTFARPEAEHVVREAYEHVRSKAGPTTCAIVGGNGLPLRRWFPYKAGKASVLICSEKICKLRVSPKNLLMRKIESSSSLP